MSKVLLDYNPATGQVSTSNGFLVGTYVGLQPYDVFDKPKVEDIVKLKEAGFTAEEIVMLVKKEVL